MGVCARSSWRNWSIALTLGTEEITVLGDYPKIQTTIAPLTPYDKWDGEMTWLILRLNIVQL